MNEYLYAVGLKDVVRLLLDGFSVAAASATHFLAIELIRATFNPR